MARQYRPENPDLPTLDPWRNTTKPPAEQFVFERNPFFHRVDENGLQLPYIDQFVLNVSSSSIIPAKTGAGESDLQFTGIDFADYTFLKDAEKRYPIKVNLWKRTQGSRVALLPNLNCGRRRSGGRCCRTCASAAPCRWRIDRREINMAVFYGLGKESADTVLPESPLYKQEYAEGLDRSRSGPGQRAARRGRPRQARRRRHPPAARRAAGADHRRIGRRKHARDRRARTRHRSLEQDRHLAVHPDLAARHLPQPRDGRRDHDGDLVGHRQRRADRRHESRARWRRPSTTSCNGRSGACTIYRAARRARRRRCRRSSKLVELSSSGGEAPSSTSAPRSGTRCCRSTPTRSSRSASSTRRCSRWSSSSQAAQHARRRPLRLRSDLLSRRLHAGHFLAEGGS